MKHLKYLYSLLHLKIVFMQKTIIECNFLTHCISNLIIGKLIIALLTFEINYCKTNYEERIILSACLIDLPIVMQ